MLVLSRKRDESIIIEVDGRLITVLVSSIAGDKVRIGIGADKDIAIHREEVYHAIQREQREQSAVPAA